MKIIQIIDRVAENDSSQLCALCDDGTLWVKRYNNTPPYAGYWEQIDMPPMAKKESEISIIIGQLDEIIKLLKEGVNWMK